jgi:Kef-type K+ transport system membrane component KefB
MLDYEPRAVNEPRTREKRQLLSTIVAAVLLVGSLARPLYELNSGGALIASIAAVLGTATAVASNLWILSRPSMSAQPESITHAIVRVTSGWIMWGGVIAALVDRDIARWTLFTSLGIVLCRYVLLIALGRYFDGPSLRERRHRESPPSPP